MAGKRLTHAVPRIRIPQPYCGILAAAGQKGTAGERQRHDRADRAHVPSEHPARGVLGPVPHADLGIVTSGGHPLTAVGQAYHGKTMNDSRVAGQRLAGGLTGDRVPELHLSVITASH